MFSLTHIIFTIAFLICVSEGMLIVNSAFGSEKIIKIIDAPPLITSDQYAWESIKGELFFYVFGEIIGNVSGNIGLIVDASFIKPAETIEMLQEMGAIGAISVSLPYDSPGLGYFDPRFDKVGSHLIPAVQIGPTDADFIKEQFPFITVSLIQAGENRWKDAVFSVSNYFFLSLNLAGSLGIFIFALKRQIELLINDKTNRPFRLVNFVLWIEILNMLCVIINTLSQLSAMEVFINNPGFIIFFSLNYSITVLSIVLVAFYWLEILDKVSVFRHSSNKRLQALLPFTIIAVIMLGLQIANIVLQLTSSINRGIIIQVQFIIFIILAASFSLFFIIQGVKMMLYFQQTVTSKKRYQQATKYLIFSGFANLGYIAVCIIGLTNLFWIPEINLFLYFFLEYSIMIGSVLRVGSFSLKRADGTSTTTSSPGAVEVTSDENGITMKEKTKTITVNNSNAATLGVD